jgi:hypothetical protein
MLAGTFQPPWSVSTTNLLMFFFLIVPITFDRESYVESKISFCISLIFSLLASAAERDGGTT